MSVVFFAFLFIGFMWDSLVGFDPFHVTGVRADGVLVLSDFQRLLIRSTAHFIWPSVSATVVLSVVVSLTVQVQTRYS